MKSGLSMRPSMIGIGTMDAIIYLPMIFIAKALNPVIILPAAIVGAMTRKPVIIALAILVITIAELSMLVALHPYGHLINALSALMAPVACLAWVFAGRAIRRFFQI